MPGHSVAAIAAMEERERKLDKRREHMAQPVGESYLLYERDTVIDEKPSQKRHRDDMNPCLNSTYR